MNGILCQFCPNDSKHHTQLSPRHLVYQTTKHYAKALHYVYLTQTQEQSVTRISTIIIRIKHTKYKQAVVHVVYMFVSHETGKALHTVLHKAHCASLILKFDLKYFVWYS